VLQAKNLKALNKKVRSSDKVVSVSTKVSKKVINLENLITPQGDFHSYRQAGRISGNHKGYKLKAFVKSLGTLYRETRKTIKE
jgi:hypothetical protein